MRTVPTVNRAIREPHREACHLENVFLESEDLGGTS
jgi:hypothetical protein